MSNKKRLRGKKFFHWLGTIYSQAGRYPSYQYMRRNLSESSKNEFVRGSIETRVDHEARIIEMRSFND